MDFFNPFEPWISKRKMISKDAANYRPALGIKQACGNCVMFHSDGNCDLVVGKINSGDVCDYWEAK